MKSSRFISFDGALSIKWIERQFFMLRCALLLTFFLSVILPAQAQTLTVLYSFADMPDGNTPLASLIAASGNLYSTTFGGGIGAGTVFKLSLSGTETVLHRFNLTDGFGPTAKLTRDSAGNFYGTTVTGGAFNHGAVFKLSPSGTETVLYSFMAGADGELPESSLVMDVAGNLYGTTLGGGSTTCDEEYGCGIVFKIDPAGHETILHTFTGGGVDGEFPDFSDLVMDSAGNLYGVTSEGGIVTEVCFDGCGTVFKIDPHGVETVLYYFAGGPDGRLPRAGLLRDRNGNLYGTTQQGGDLTCDCGTVFKLSPTGSKTVLYSFLGGEDGNQPRSPLIMDSAGNLVGITYQGGHSNAGTVFRVSRQGVETVLHSFSQPTEGGHPLAGLILDAQGNMYGTTSESGPAHHGTVFKLAPQ